MGLAGSPATSEPPAYVRQAACSVQSEKSYAYNTQFGDARLEDAVLEREQPGHGEAGPSGRNHRR